MVVCMCLAQGVTLLEGGALLEEVCHCGVGLETLLLVPPRMLNLFIASFG
ncbi:rCG59223 [Rattus norvegicus]|uniref:RCG59223 n=1 Tax=Rattus norvegicus TaxID=10116 RepID=A6K7Q9_RAT|nr:rCG59223 [Rattus norvegicus]